VSEKAELIALSYLLGGSQVSLQNTLLNRLADAQNRRKEIIELLDAWAERHAEVLLLEWFVKHGDELMASVTRMETVIELKRLAEPEKPGPQRLEDFRESLRNLLESA
jgi:hypothetical protein